MKLIKKSLTITLCLLMLFTMTLNAYAADTATLTISGTTAGATYHLYKIFDLSQSGEAFAYTMNSDFEGFFEGKGWTDPVAEIKALEDSDELSVLGQELLSWAIANSVEPAYKITSPTTQIKVSDVEYGYYLMNPVGASGGSEGNVTMFSLDTVSGNDATITVKAEYPTISKQVNGSAEPVAANIGDTLTFTITAKVPDMTGYSSYTFVVTDTMSAGLTFGDITSVTVGGTAMTAYSKSTSTSSGVTTLTVTLNNFIDYADASGEEVVITYTAVLNENAEINAANYNTAKLTYSNDPTDSTSTGETAEVRTDVYTTALYINKIDNAGAVLTDAAFSLTGNTQAVLTEGEIYVVEQNGGYWQLKDGSFVDGGPGEANVDGQLTTEDDYADLNTEYAKYTALTMDNPEAYVDSTGALSFSGLGTGTYTITETVTPEGYNNIDPITVTVAFDAESAAFTITADDGTVNGNTLTVVNQSGAELPSTGSTGTWMIYLVGAVLILSGLTLKLKKKRV